MEKWEVGSYVFFKWAQEVCKIVKVTENHFIIQNIKDGSLYKESKEELLYIYNM